MSAIMSSGIDNPITSMASDLTILTQLATICNNGTGGVAAGKLLGRQDMVNPW